MIHVTEYGLGVAAGIPRKIKGLRAVGLRPDRIACTGEAVATSQFNVDVIPTLWTAIRLPTCPRCSVLRDAALSGTLPALPPRHDQGSSSKPPDDR